MKTRIQNLVAALVWLALPTLLQAQYNYTDNGDGTCTITGYTGSGGDVVIPTTIDGLTVAGIGENAFAGLPSLTSVTITNSIISIGTGAFAFCNNLTDVTITNSVTSIGDIAFNFCTSLINVTLGNGIKNIGVEAFDYCTSLTNVAIPNGVTNIGEQAFFDCYALTNVTIPNSVTKIGNQAFYQCSSLTSVTIPYGVLSIEEYTFLGCISLTNATIPNSVTSIGQYAFAACYGLTSMTIPKSVTTIGHFGFLSCTNLTSAYFLGNSPLDDGSTFTDCPTIVYYLAGTTGWGSTFGTAPAELWNPQPHSPTLTGGQFGFDITGPTNAVIVVEACTNLSNPVWLPVATNTFSSSGTSTFTDPLSGGHPCRYYRFRAP